MASAGEPGHISTHRHKELTTPYIMKIFGTCSLDGLNPSPIIKSKMIPQSVDKVQGNDFIAESMGSNAELKYENFWQ
eukprot:12659961-Ditylum_brightwellii.AAC.1